MYLTTRQQHAFLTLQQLTSLVSKVANVNLSQSTTRFASYESKRWRDSSGRETTLFNRRVKNGGGRTPKGQT